MATKIKGITIELGADASGLEKAIKSVSKELSSTQKQLTSVNKALKLDPGNLDLIEQKQRTLASAVEQTTTKLQALKQAQEKLKTEGGAQNQYDALTREISETQVTLKDLNAEQRRFGMEAATAQAKASTLSQGLSKVGSVASQVAQQTAMISAAAAGALAAMTGLAVSAGQTADEWLTLSQQTGLSTESIQKFAYAAEQIDVPLPTITGAITKMKSHLDDTSGIWDRIGVKVKNQHQQYRSIEDIFYETVEALGNIENETERDTVAMQIFGKSANELAGLIDDGGQKLKALGDEADNLGVIVSEDDLEKLGHFNDLLEGMKSQMKAAAMQAAIPVMEAILPLVDDIAQGVQVLAKVLSAIPTPIIQILAVVLGLVAVLSPVAMGISAIANSINVLITVLPALGQAISLVVTQATALIGSNPYVIAIVAIIAALALLGVAIYEIVSHWDQISSAATSAFSSVKSAASGLLSAVSGVGKGIISIFADVPQAVENVASVFGSLVGKIVQVVSKILSAFKDLADKAKNAGKEVMEKFTSGVQSVISKVTQAFSKLASTISNIFSGMERDASGAGSRVASNFVQAYERGTSYIKSPTISYSTSASAAVGSARAAASEPARNTSLSTNSSRATNVTVELVGSAKNIFDTVRVQNNTLATATGYHALS